MATLPTPGSDLNSWGDELNEFLRIAHAEDGGLKKGTVFPNPAVVGQPFLRTDTTPPTLYVFVGPAQGVDWYPVGRGTDHEQLNNLQGGLASDRFHLTAVQTGNLPSADQKGALSGTSGTPSATNKYVTDADARNANARTPTAHAATHKGDGSDPVDIATTVVNGLMSASDKTKLNKVLVPGEPQYVDTILLLSLAGTTNQQTYGSIGNGYRIVVDVDAHKRTGLTPNYWWQLVAGRSGGAGTFDIRLRDVTNAVTLAEFTARTDAAGTLFAKTPLAGLPATGRIVVELQALTSVSATTVQIQHSSVAIELTP